MDEIQAVNSGVEDAYIGRLKVSFGKTIDLKTQSTSDCWSPFLCKHLIVCSHSLSVLHCINVMGFFPFCCVHQDGELTKEEILEKHDAFVGSQATDFGEALTRHDEF